MEFLCVDFLKHFLEGSVDHVIYWDYIMNRRFFIFLFAVVWSDSVRELADVWAEILEITCSYSHTALKSPEILREVSRVSMSPLLSGMFGCLP